MKRWLVITCFLVVFCLTAFYYTAQIKHSSSGSVSPIRVYKKNNKDFGAAIPYVWRPLSPSLFNVFFIETSCAFKSIEPGFLHLTKRQACAIYSTAILNPNHRIILIHTCPLIKDYSHRWEEDWPELLSLGNVGVVEADISWLLSDTPIISLLNGRLNRSAYPIEHTADLVRLAVLYKYGGTYLDTDIISIRPLDGLGFDYIGAQEATVLANGIMHFSPTAVGHQFIKETLAALKFSYEGSEWAANGPALVTTELRKFCNIDEGAPLSDLGKLDCGLTIHPPSLFYPVPYWEWKQFLDETAWPRIKNRINNTYILHFWNKLSKDTVIRVGSQQPYGILAANYCSPIYHKDGGTF